MIRWQYPSLFFVAFLMPGLAGAQDPMTPTAQADLLEHVVKGVDRGVTWLSGGVGDAERQAIMDAAVGSYNLKLEFARQDGSYLGDVDVLIRDSHGATMLEVSSNGPWLLTNLPAGTYRVSASANGRTFEEAVAVPGSGLKTIVFSRWTAEDDIARGG